MLQLSPTNPPKQKKAKRKFFRRNRRLREDKAKKLHSVSIAAEAAANAAKNNFHQCVRDNWMKLIEEKLDEGKKEEVVQMVEQNKNVIEIFDRMVKEGHITINSQMTIPTTAVATLATVPKKKTPRKSIKILFIPNYPAFFMNLKFRGFWRLRLTDPDPENWYQKTSPHFKSTTTVVLVVPDFWKTNPAIKVIQEIQKMVKFLKVIIPSRRKSNSLCQKLFVKKICVAVCKNDAEEYQIATRNLNKNEPIQMNDNEAQTNSKISTNIKNEPSINYNQLNSYDDIRKRC